MDELRFNPMDPAFVADPYPTYRRLRAEDPVHQSPLGFWVLTRYEDVVAALRDPRLAKEAIPAFVAARFGLPVAGPGLSMLDRDPPDHTRLRGLVSKAFTPRVVDVLRPHIQQIVDGLLDRVENQGGMDLVEDFAYPLPVTVICEMLGVPVEDRERFKIWGLDIARGLDAIWLPPDSDVAKRSLAARHELADYFRHLIARRRAQPRADMLSGLIAAEEAGDKLNEEDLLATCILLLVAGHETTVNLIGNGMLALLRHPGQLHRLQEDPGLMVTAVEELLRYDGPVQRTARIPSEDVTIGGLLIPKGELVMPFIGAADRDPAQFRDPERLDITRTDNRHIAFGWGIHFCLGAPLARIEGQIAIGTIVRRLPNLRLATEAPAFRQSLTLRGLSTLPVTF
jgi:cytochrome P450